MMLKSRWIVLTHFLFNSILPFLLLLTLPLPSFPPPPLFTNPLSQFMCMLCPNSSFHFIRIRSLLSGAYRGIISGRGDNQGMEGGVGCWITEKNDVLGHTYCKGNEQASPLLRALLLLPPFFSPFPPINSFSSFSNSLRSTFLVVSRGYGDDLGITNNV